MRGALVAGRSISGGQRGLRLPASQPLSRHKGRQPAIRDVSKPDAAHAVVEKTPQEQRAGNRAPSESDAWFDRLIYKAQIDGGIRPRSPHHLFFVGSIQEQGTRPECPSVENLEERARPPARTRRRISRPTLVTIDLIFSTPPETTQRLIMNC